MLQSCGMKGRTLPHHAAFSCEAYVETRPKPLTRSFVLLQAHQPDDSVAISICAEAHTPVTVPRTAEQLLISP